MEQDAKNNTDNAELSATRQTYFPMPDTFEGINLYDIENDKLASETINKWLKSPHDKGNPDGPTWNDFLETQGFTLTYWGVDEKGDRKLWTLKITRIED